MRIAEIISVIEQVAPRGLQEDWDNTGLQVGNSAVECTGVLVCVDVTPEVVDEAIELGCNLIVSHHPLIFKGLKRITGNTPVEAAVANAIAAGVSVYSNHTALDNAPGGVSHRMAQMLGVKALSVLAPLDPHWLKLSVMVPDSHAQSVRLALFDAGAGELGSYDCCSFNVNGTGTFRAMKGANPFVGEIDQLHSEPETRIDVVLPDWARQRVENILLEVHPYECPAYEFMRPEGPSGPFGTGVYGTLEPRLTPLQLIEKIKEVFHVKTVRCSSIEASMDMDTPISRVALCGGSGGEFIPNAVSAGAQVYITGDIRYHDFVDRQSQILLMDIGHYESEECTKDIFYQIISKKFANFAVYKCKSGLNPVNYL